MTDEATPTDTTREPGDRIWYDPSRRCVTVIREGAPRTWVYVREATPDDRETLPYYGAVHAPTPPG